MTDKLRDLTAEDREWIDARADQLYRDSERQRGGIRPATIMPQDFRDYFVAQAAWERARAALAAAPQPAPAPAADERDAMIEVIVQADDAYDRVQGGTWAGAIADALLAAGYRKADALLAERDALIHDIERAKESESALLAELEQARGIAR